MLFYRAFRSWSFPHLSIIRHPHSPPPPSCPTVVIGDPSSLRCALSGKGIQYWDIIPKVFHLDAEADHLPCPFAGPAYQWMRNLVVAYKVARQKNKQPAVVIVYAESPGLPMAKKVRSKAWTQFARTVKQDQVPLHVRSYQEILTLAQETTRHGSGEQTVWGELEEWVNRKISTINGDPRKPKRKIPSHSNTISAHRNGGGEKSPEALKTRQERDVLAGTVPSSLEVSAGIYPVKRLPTPYP